MSCLCCLQLPCGRQACLPQVKARVRSTPSNSAVSYLPFKLLYVQQSVLLTSTELQRTFASNLRNAGLSSDVAVEFHQRSKSRQSALLVPARWSSMGQVFTALFDRLFGNREMRVVSARKKLANCPYFGLCFVPCTLLSVRWRTRMCMIHISSSSKQCMCGCSSTITCSLQGHSA